ncbi:MAG: hypothetical protein Q9182_002388 [Xanthomendoza sp. 2 TL-2023]
MASFSLILVWIPDQCSFISDVKSLTSHDSRQASFLRKINRSGQQDSNEALSEQVDEPGAALWTETHLQHHTRRHDRAGSEPTEQLLSSIPLHLRSHHRSPQSPPLFKRNVSDANSHLPGTLERPTLLHQESDGSSDLVESRGLSVLYRPSKVDLDLVFIHGLGGSSLKTWSFARRTENFWPLWLSQDPEFVATRILTFGYNADFRGPSTILNITDFAKDLVSRMLTFDEEIEDEPRIRIGQAYILGRQDPMCSKVFEQVRGIVFLATPHGGASDAKLLNSILEASPFSTSRKEYIAQLEPTSHMLQDINDQFSKTCGELALVSFYETMRTVFARGVKKIVRFGTLIVERASAILGYPQEHSSPLAADHHSICKYASNTDENFVCVKGFLKIMRSKIEIATGLSTALHATEEPLGSAPIPSAPDGASERPSSAAEVTKGLQELLGIIYPVESDLNAKKSQKMAGSCQWLPCKQSFQEWFERAGTDTPIFILTAPPAAGKSTLASYVVEWIQDVSLDTACQYYFFISDHQVKRTVSYCLRMIAFQLAIRYDVVREALLRLKDETNATFERQSPKDIWEKIFQGIIFRIPFKEDLFWILDALDESDTPSSLCDMLIRSRSTTPIKMLVTSRETRDMSNFIYNAKDKVIHEALTPADTYQDIKECVSATIQANLPHDRESRDDVIDQILSKASGSFLWVRLTLDTIRDSWHTQEDIRKALRDVPEGMEPLYAEMLGHINQQNPSKRAMAREILTWIVCSYRPLSLFELQAALTPTFGEFLSLEDTISQICGHFVRVTDSKVTLVHATGRQFLLNQSSGFIDKHEGHQKLALACLRYLSDDSWRHIFALSLRNPKMTKSTIPSRYSDEHPFLTYATHHWAYHVKNAVCNRDELWDALDTFIHGYILVWIHGIAISSNLQTLVRTAQDLRYFCHRYARVRANTADPPISLKTHDTQWLRSWATDLIRIVGKFGRVLLQNPLSIYRLIPVFCPSKSQIGTVYGRTPDLGISIAGISSSWWDDCMARVSGIENETISRVFSTVSHFVTLVSTKGKAIVWSSETCAELRTIYHSEYTTHMAVNKLGTVLATAGIRTVRVWELLSGKEIGSFPQNSEAKTMTMVFGQSDGSLIIGREDFSVQTYDISSGLVTSTFWTRPRQNSDMNGPRFMTISPDLTKIAVAERGKPVFVWDMESFQDQLPWRCVRHTDRLRSVHEQEAWTASEVACWHPDGTSIFILYQGSGIVHWNFTEDSQKEYSHIEGREIVLSKDGNFLLTSDPSGTLYVWASPRFNLIYKLFDEDIVRDIAFSPDGQRIYDSRGAICNVWEPDILIRHDDGGRDEVSSNHEGGAESSILSDSVTQISQNNSTVSQVTALVCDPQDEYYCCGRDDGSVTIHSAKDGSKVRKVYNHSSTASIVALEWSKSGRFIVSGDDAGRIICKRLESKGVGTWAVFPGFDIRFIDLVRQFVFHPSEGSLLISMESSDLLWSIRGKLKKEICRKSWLSSIGRRWILCPDDTNKLLWIDRYKIDTYGWEDLELHQSQSIDLTPADEGKRELEASRPSLNRTTSSGTESVRCISATRNGQHLVTETVSTGSFSSLAPCNMRVHQVSAFSPTSKKSNAVRRVALLDLAQQTSRVLGIFNDRILFLDVTFWVCTWELTGLVPAMKRHFFLPRDWISPTSIQLVTYNEHGTVFCPRNGEVAIVRDGINS